MTTAVDAGGAGAPKKRSFFQRYPIASRLLRHKAFIVGALLFAVIAFVAIFAGWLTSADPNRMAVRFRFRPPSPEFWMGTDNLGRSILARIFHGARLSLAIGLAVVIMNAVFGVALGAASGYFKRLDNILMRVTDALMAFPPVLLALGIAAALGPSSMAAAIALAAVYIPRTARIVRASVLVVREMEFVQAALAMGASNWRILRKHVLPNCMAPLIVQLTFVFAFAVVTEATLSFLGLGSPPPTPTWGNMIAEGRQYIRDASWITLIPGLALAVTVLSLNLLGDGLRDVLDPRLKVAQD